MRPDNKCIIYISKPKCRLKWGCAQCSLLQVLPVCVTCTARDMDNLTFSEDGHEETLQVVLRQNVGGPAANHGSSVHGCV